MHELLLEDVSLNINEVQIASKANMRIQGMCALQISSDAYALKEILLLFTKTHMYATNRIKVEGNAYFDGNVFPASKIHCLLNHGIIFEGNDSVKDVLTMLNRDEAELLMENLEITFPNKRVDHLNIQESKIFEVAVNLATKARVVFIKNFEISTRLKKTCFEFLRKYASTREVVFLIETEYSDAFDSAVYISGNNITSLDKSECEIFFNRQRLAVFNIESSSEEKSVPPRIVTRCEGGYDYKKIFLGYKTENLVDIKHRTLPFLSRLLTYDLYRINPVHAFYMGFRKYEAVFQRQDRRMSVVKSISPCVILILLVRMVQEIRKGDWIGCLPGLSAYLLMFFLNPKREFAPMLLYFIKNLYIQECSAKRILAIVRHIFKGEYSTLEYRLVSAPVCLCIFYQYSSIFEEDSQALNYYMNIMMTPGTYVMSIFIYMFFTHMITFNILGYLFNINFMSMNVLYSFFTNLVYCPFIGARLRSAIIAFYLATFIVGLLQGTERGFLEYLLKVLCPIFPSSTFIEQYRIAGITFQTLYILVSYCAVSYIICCYKISER